MKSYQNIFGNVTTNDMSKIKWGWFVALGTMTLLLGVLAFGNLSLATSATVFYVGVFMAIGGVLQIIHGIQLRSWSGFLYFTLSGLLYLAAGIIAFENPILAATTLTLFLSLTLMASGIIRVWSSLGLRDQYGWGWILTSGLVTLAAGIVFMMDWPLNSLWLLGMVLAVDLTFQGFSAVMLGLNLSSANAPDKIFASVV